MDALGAESKVQSKAVAEGIANDKRASAGMVDGATPEDFRP